MFRHNGSIRNEGYRRGPFRPNFEKKPIHIPHYECPRSPDGRPVVVPMRFEVVKQDGENADVTEQLKEFFRNALRNAARIDRIDIDDNGMNDIRVNSVEGMHSRWVSCSNWPSTLCSFACNFLSLAFKREETPILYTHSPLIYPLRLINVHKDIPFRRIRFGSFINNGLIGYHWNIEGGKATPQDRGDGFSFKKYIDVYFEYDRGDININFHNSERNPEDDEPCLTKYKINIKMTSIKRIGLDQEKCTDGSRRRSLILHVNHAPKIQVQWKKEGNDRMGNSNDRRNQSFNGNPYGMQNRGSSNNEQQQWSKWEHRLHIQRGRYPGEVSDPKALHGSNLIVLEFDEQLTVLDPPSSTLDQLIFDILSRLHHKTGKAVEFSSYDQEEMLEGLCRRYYSDDECVLEKVDPYGVDDFDGPVLQMIKNASQHLVLRSREKSFGDKFVNAHQIELKTFRLRALLEGILQRGMQIRIQLLRNRETWHSFVKLACEQYQNNEQKTLAVLENLLSVIEGKPHCTVASLFEKEWKDCGSGQRATVFTKEEKLKGFTRVMKFVKTSTRLMFVGYETIMTNRVLKHYSGNGTEIIRVTFRDDSGANMHENASGSIMRDTMREVLIKEGIHFAGRQYKWLGNSNSQLRDHGVYMYHSTDRQSASGCFEFASEIRSKLGKFHELTSICKWLARQGQCFTQARPSGIRFEVGVTHDFVGGKTEKDKPYCFSDGVGTISFSKAKELSDEHSSPRIASAFQIRHKGQKGLVAVDPTIDDRRELLKMMGKESEGKDVFVRPSMDKFEVDETSRGGVGHIDTSHLEIVKYSSASPLFLNRPLLNILSQVTEDQSPESHRRMSNRVQDLLDIQLTRMTQSLYIEHRARETIQELSFPFIMEVFNNANPLKFTSEPFLRSLLIANAKFVTQRQLSKMNIRIPSDYGRSMFGVVDTTGVLQYGQIFCQYSTSTSKHSARSRSYRRDGADGALILTGPVMITKNPCIEKGDVRRFDAIDVPGLRHLVDVVVFPQHGPRPHPDQMAGSDLDGDDYSLIWDPDMLFDRNEEASVFPSGEDVTNWPIERHPDGRVNVELCEKRLTEFYIEAVTQEQVGVLCSAHLATSDFYGLENKASRSLAGKVAQSLDFQKNGVRPKKMTTSEDKHPDDARRVIPAEKAVRKPDYMEKRWDVAYESRGIMAKLYQESKRHQDAINWGDEQKVMIDKDPDFNLPGWQKYELAVKREMDAYCYGLRTLMEYYGVSEAEILSGQMLKIKNRLSEKEVDEMNLYNTNLVIEEKVKREIGAAREAFFRPLLKWEDELHAADTKRRDVDKDSILSRVFRSTTTNNENIRLKAAAAYHVCYDAANRQLENGDQSSLMLSFPWVFYDVLADIKLRPDVRIVRVIPEEKREESNEPLAKVLSNFVDDYCEHKSKLDGFVHFKSRFEKNSLLRRSMDENEGFARASFVLVQWAKHNGGLRDQAKFNEHHLVALFLKFGLGETHVRGTRKRYIQRPSGEIREHLRKGEHLLMFIEYLASRQFRTCEFLRFGDILPGALMRGEWKAFAELCIPAYLALVTTHRFDLPVEEETDSRALRAVAALKEYEPRIIELPDDIIKNKLEDVRRDLITASGCIDVQLRSMGGGKPTQAFVSAIGSSESFKKLNALVISPAPNRCDADVKDLGLPKMVYDRLVMVARDADNR